MTEAKPLKVQRHDKSLDRANGTISAHIIFDPRRQRADLIPAYPGLERAIRHTEPYTRRRKRLGFLPSLFAPSSLRSTGHDDEDSH